MRKYVLQITLSFVVVLFFLGHSARFYQVPLLNTFDAFIYDTRLRLTMPKGVDERIVILDIDEKSLAAEGHWPWGRDKLAHIMTNLFSHYHVAVVGLDVVFAEADTSSGLNLLENLSREKLRNDTQFNKILENLRPELDYNQRFAESIKGYPVVLGYYFSAQRERRSGTLPAPALLPWMLSGKKPQWIINLEGYGANLPELQKAAASGGHFIPEIDFDGIGRRVPMLVEHDDAYYESLSLAVVRTLFGGVALEPNYADGVLEALSLRTPQGVLKIPVDEKVTSLVPYRGNQRSFPYISLSDVLHKKVPVEALQEKIVLIGSSTPGLMDLRATPVSSVYPGVEIHANLIAGILDGTIPYSPDYALGIDLAQILISALLLICVLPRVSPFKASVLGLGLFGLVFVGNLWFWSKGFVIPLASLLISILAIYTLNMCWGYFVESRSKRQFAELFGQYVPPELVDEMARDPQRYSMEGKSQELSVLFSDVRGFTGISEKLDPKELALLMNEYLGAMTEVVQHYRGTLDKYIGDALMAFWGAPIEDSQHALHAVKAALDMQKALRKLDAPFAARGWPTLSIGVGINTGTMIVGDMGSTVRKSYTVMGDAVNLGARLESATKHYGVSIIISESTYAAVAGLVCRELDHVRVKGREEPVVIYEPLGFAKQLSAQECEDVALWQQALSAYRHQNWEEAAQKINDLLDRTGDCLLYRIYLERIEKCRSQLPDKDWDGVVTLTIK